MKYQDLDLRAVVLCRSGWCIVWVGLHHSKIHDGILAPRPSLEVRSLEMIKSRMSPNSMTGKCPYKKRTDTRTREGHVMMEAEAGVMHLQVKAHQGLPAIPEAVPFLKKRHGTDAPLESSEESGPQ